MLASKTMNIRSGTGCCTLNRNGSSKKFYILTKRHFLICAKYCHYFVCYDYYLDKDTYEELYIDPEPGHGDMEPPGTDECGPLGFILRCSITNNIYIFFNK